MVIDTTWAYLFNLQNNEAQTFVSTVCLITVSNLSELNAIKFL